MNTEFLFAYLGLIILFFNSLFLIAQNRKDFSIVDIGWGLGFILLAISSFVTGDIQEFEQALITTLVLIWGVRLSAYIYMRNKDKDEDPRYAAWRKAWGQWATLRGYLQVFILQAILLWLIALPVIHLNHSVGQLNLAFTMLGLTVWIVGFVWESIADYHLYIHLSKPGKKSLLTTGVWKSSRHPNYFGEATMWWGIWLIAASDGGAAYYTIISPILITVLLRFVSGVPLSEKHKAKNPQFKKYASKTNAMFPWWPKQ